MSEEEKYFEKYWLNGSLALESYQDDMHRYNIYVKEKDEVINACFKLLNEFDVKANLASVEDKLVIRKKEYKELNKVINYLGKEYFTFYDDGDVDYNRLYIKERNN